MNFEQYKRVFPQTRLKDLPTLLAGRKNLRPIGYQWALEALERSYSSPWFWQEISMQQDLVDWEQATEEERRVIAGILLGFTLIEQEIGDYWAEVVATEFPHPEIKSVARSYSSQEANHAFSYDHLEATLGLNTYEAFTQNRTASEKLAYFSQSGDLALDLAIFSGIGEYVSLASSFAILLSFCRTGRFKGLKQIISYSAIEELTQHAETAFALFNQLVKEDPSVKPQASDVYGAFDIGYSLELSFIKQAFGESNSIGNITYDQIENFISLRCNEALEKLGYEANFGTSEDSTVADWFYPMALSSSYNDFFSSSKAGNNYSHSIKQDFLSINPLAL